MAQNRIKQQVDKGRSEREFEVGEKFYLKLQPSYLKAMMVGPVSKLCPRYYGPFPIIAKLGSVAYKLQLLENFQIHPVFHVSLLKKSVGNQVVSPSLTPRMRGREEVAEPIAILDRRVIYKHGDAIAQALVKWSTIHEDNNTCEYLPDLLQQFPRVANLLCIS